MNITSKTSNDFCYNVGDCIEFKKFLSTVDAEKEYALSKGKIVDTSDRHLFEVAMYGDTENLNNNNLNNNLNNLHTNNTNNKNNKNTKNTCWVSPLSIVNHYPAKIIPRLSVRLVLKNVWKDLIFREVKTVKTKDQSMVTYQYVNNEGFVRCRRFESVEEAYRYVPLEKRKNIQVHYWDYFGFTTHRPIRNNDIYCNQEIFFSKKCYGELNLNNATITGGFYQRRGFNGVPPDRKQYICGLVEVGEKGLFYRKWFVCSEEFLTLWTMVCETEHHSLKNNINGKYITKSLDQILSELDTSHYNITNSNMSTEEKQTNYRVHNIETQAIHIPNIYQRIAKKLFRSDNTTSDDLYLSYEDRFESDLMWMKNM